MKRHGYVTHHIRYGYYHSVSPVTSAALGTRPGDHYDIYKRPDGRFQWFLKAGFADDNGYADTLAGAKASVKVAYDAHRPL